MIGAIEQSVASLPDICAIGNDLLQAAQAILKALPELARAGYTALPAATVFINYGWSAASAHPHIATIAAVIFGSWLALTVLPTIFRMVISGLILGFKGTRFAVQYSPTTSTLAAMTMIVAATIFFSSSLIALGVGATAKTIFDLNCIRKGSETFFRPRIFSSVNACKVGALATACIVATAHFSPCTAGAIAGATLISLIPTIGKKLIVDPLTVLIYRIQADILSSLEISARYMNRCTPTG